MKSTFYKAFLAFAFVIGFSQTQVQAQTVTAGPDSTLIRATVADSLAPKIKGLSGPGKAALMSAVVPGLGQIHNKSYWKVPLVYAAIGGAAYAIKFNHDNYLHYRLAVQVRADRNPDNNVDRFTPRLEGRSVENQLTVLRRARNNHRRWRDLSILYTLLAYGLNITEAYVHAHLKGFDVSDDLAIQVQPDILRTASNKYTPGLSLSINFKK